MKSENEYAVFILSHGRADDVKTVKMLQGGNYTGKWLSEITSWLGAKKNH